MTTVSMLQAAASDNNQTFTSDLTYFHALNLKTADCLTIKLKIYKMTHVTENEQK